MKGRPELGLFCGGGAGFCDLKLVCGLGAGGGGADGGMGGGGGAPIAGGGGGGGGPLVVGVSFSGNGGGTLFLVAILEFA